MNSKQRKRRRIVDIASFSSSSLEGKCLEGVVTRVWPLRDTKEAGKKERYLDSELVFNLEVEENVTATLSRPKASIEVFFYDRFAARCSRARKGDIIRLSGSGVIGAVNPLRETSADHYYCLIVAEHNASQSDNNIKIQIFPHRNEAEHWAITKEKSDSEAFGPPVKITPKNLYEYDSWVDQQPRQVPLGDEGTMERICEELDVNASDLSRKERFQQGPYLALKAANKGKSDERATSSKVCMEQSSSTNLRASALFMEPTRNEAENPSKKPKKKRKFFAADIAQLIKEKRRKSAQSSLGRISNSRGAVDDSIRPRSVTNSNQPGMNCAISSGRNEGEVHATDTKSAVVANSVPHESVCEGESGGTLLQVSRLENLSYYDSEIQSTQCRNVLGGLDDLSPPDFDKEVGKQSIEKPATMKPKLFSKVSSVCQESVRVVDSQHNSDERKSLYTESNTSSADSCKLVTDSGAIASSASISPKVESSGVGLGEEEHFWPTQSSSCSSMVPSEMNRNMEHDVRLRNESKMQRTTEDRNPLAQSVSNGVSNDTHTAADSAANRASLSKSTLDRKNQQNSKPVAVVHPPKQHSTTPKSDYTPLRNLVLDKKANIIGVVVDRVFPRNARRGTDYSGQILITDDSTDVNIIVQIFSKNLQSFPRYVNFGDIIIFRNAKVQQFRNQPQILCNKHDTKFAILRRGLSGAPAEQEQPTSLDIGETDQSRAEALKRWFDHVVTSKNFFPLNYLHTLEDGFAGNSLFCDTIACISQQPQHLTAENGDLDQGCIRFTVWDGSNLEYRYKSDAYPHQAYPLCRGSIVPVIANCHIDIIESLNITQGTWVRLRNVKFHRRSFETESTETPNEASTTKVIYIQEHSGMMVLPEQCRDVQMALERYQERAQQLPSEEEQYNPQNCQPPTVVYDTHIEAFNDIRELAYPRKTEFEKFKVRAVLVAHTPLDVRDFCTRSESNENEYEYFFQLRFIDPSLRNVSVGSPSCIDVVVQGSDAEQFLNIPPTNLYENEASANAIARRLELLFQSRSFDVCVALVPRRDPQESHDWIYMLTDTAIVG